MISYFLDVSLTTLVFHVQCTSQRWHFRTTQGLQSRILVTRAVPVPSEQHILEGSIRNDVKKQEVVLILSER